MNYFPFHVGDYASHTAHLEPLEDLAYRRMLDLYYMREEPLPEDIDAIARLIRLRDNKAEIRAVLTEFFSFTPEGYRHYRCDAELAKMQDRQAKAQASARASVNARRANAERALNERSADVELPTPTPTPKKDIVVSPAAPPHGTRLDKGWALPDDWRAWCIEHRPDLDPQSVADQFRDFWVAKPGKDGRKADWLATWRNWCRSQKPGTGKPRQNLTDEGYRDLMRGAI